jgi:hypothetical protein
MTLLWLVAGAALVIALIALVQARRAFKQLEQVSRNYWELKYQNGELRVRLQQVAGDPTPQQTTAPAAAQGRDSFVPLSSLKR